MASQKLSRNTPQRDTCAADDSDGFRCNCPTFRKRTDRSGKHKSRCKDCGHSARHHPSPASPQGPSVSHETTIQEILARHRSQQPATQAVKVSHEDARAEVLAGFRPTKPLNHIMSSSPVRNLKSGRTASGRATSSSKRKGSSSKPDKMKDIGSILLHPGGLATTGQGRELRLVLRDTRYPSPELEEDLRDCQLLVTKTPDGATLQFNPKWGRPALDDWFRNLFPQAVTYMDDKYGVRNNRNNSGSHWELLRRKHSTLCLVRDKNITGESLDEFKGSEGRQKSKYRICLVTRHAIPRSVYMTWRTLDITASASEMDNTDLFLKSDNDPSSGAEGGLGEEVLSSDAEDVEDTKGKGRAIATQRNSSRPGKKRTHGLAIESDSDSPSLSESESLFGDAHRDKRLKTTDLEDVIEQSRADDNRHGAQYHFPRWYTESPIDTQAALPSSDHEFALPPGNQLMLYAGGDAAVEAPGPEAAPLQEDAPLEVDGASATQLGLFRYSVNPPWGTQYLERASKGLQTPGRPERNIWEETDT